MNSSNGDDAVLVVFGIIILIALAVGLMIRILFCLTLSRCLSRVQPHNRDMEPGLVWLNLIPCFDFIWLFITVSRIASSLRKEYEDRGWRTGDESFGNGVGMAYVSLMLASMIPYVGGLFAIGSLVCFIIYWVQIAGYSGRLLTKVSSRRDDDDYYGRDRDRRYDDDYYPERGSREADDRFRENRGRETRDRDRDDRDRDY